MAEKWGPPPLDWGGSRDTLWGCMEMGTPLRLGVKGDGDPPLDWGVGREMGTPQRCGGAVGTPPWTGGVKGDGDTPLD